MYEVSLCEDERVLSEAQEKTCCGILEKLNIEYHISVFNNSMDFFKSFSEKQARYDLILLDIMMDGMDGMTLARRIREKDRDAAIIFITSNRDYAFEGYDVNALHYLMKPVDGGALERLIAADYNNRFQISYLMFESDAGKIRVATKDIICLETAGRRVEVTLKNKSVYYHGKLTELLTKLPKDKFVRCHQSYAVNIANIHELTRQDIIAVNGRAIPVSRTFAKDVQKAFAKQLREM